MTVLQVHHRFPAFTDDPDFIDHVKDEVRLRFGQELVRALSERGGIVGPIVQFSIYALVTDLPEPESYRLMGGPADGHIVKTGGSRTWRVPVVPPVLPATPFDLAEAPTIKYAEYERQGDSQVYFYRRVAR